jgi:hypothetical protein
MSAPRELYQTKVDSFGYHYRIIDSILKRNAYDTSTVLRRSVRFIERVTGIKAHPDGDYIGWKVVAGKDLRAWRDWKIEEEIDDKIYALPEVKEKGRFIDSLTHHKRGVSIMIVDKPSAKRPYYWVKVGYDSDLRFETYYNFYVYKKGLVVKFLDTTEEDEIIGLQEWRKRRKQRGY